MKNGVDAPKLFDFTELFGTRIEVKISNIKLINAAAVKDGSTHRKCASFRNAVYVVRMLHPAKDCTLVFDAPMKCANCSGAHAAHWRR
ncbi:hypothetical protein TNCV_3444481 [Trichonephila clavipes]|nr:hypothetical protein TNCV_3444481 [Trichonephila clavipes]